MDLKIENDRISTLCHGCLSADRKLTLITRKDKLLFTKLRGDVEQSENDSKELQLCWECMAVFNKMKMFQDRIKTAQYRLLQYVNTYYNQDNIPHTLSPIVQTKIKIQFDYNYNFIHEEEQQDLIIEDKNQTMQLKNLITPKKNLIPTQNETTGNKEVLDIKIENNECAVKEEYENASIDNDTDYYDTDLKIENDDDYKLLKQKFNKSEVQTQSIKRYEVFAKVTTLVDKYSKTLGLCSEKVYLTEPEIEEVLARDTKTLERMRYKCKLCSHGYIRLLDFLRHKTFHHSKSQFPTACSACNLEILTQSELEEHWKSHTAMLRCGLCATLCRSKGEMRKHLNRFHTKTYTCNNCALVFRTLRDFSNHYKRSHEKVVCDYCNSKFSSKRRLESHIKRNHLPAYCSICNRTYRTYRVFENHTRFNHPDILQCDTRKELCYCVECDKQYPSIYRYRRHVQQSARHTPRNKVRVPCPDCGKIFTRTSYMNNHYRLVHLKQSKHYCELCDKYFANGYGVRKHIQCVHQKLALPKDKICDLCGRGFSTNRILINHRRTHTGERPFKCQYCPATFAQETAMKSHQKTQHKNIALIS